MIGLVYVGECHGVVSTVLELFWRREVEVWRVSEVIQGQKMMVPVHMGIRS